MAVEDNILTIYAVGNDKGEWLRSKGFGGYGKHWVTELSNAKLYTKLGQARSRVTTWANLYPKSPVPKIYCFSMNLRHAIILEEAERVKKSNNTKAIREAAARSEYTQRQLAQAESDARDANKRLKALRKAAK